MKEKQYRLSGRMAAAALVLCSFLINYKNILTSCQVDAQYQVAMAYRLLQGDHMFSQMWEAHQTSAFFLAFFEWIFLKVTGSTTGILVYANVVGILCKTAVAFCAYGTLKKFADRKMAFAALLFLLNAYPKDVVLPDFANLQVWFGTLLMCCLIWYVESRRRRWLIFSALCLCLEVLVYPSCALLWVLCVILFLRYAPGKWRDIGIFTGICGACGMLYLLYFMRGNPRQFLQYIYYIWSGDESHATGLGERLAVFGQELLVLASDMRYILATAVCALLAAGLFRSFSKRRGDIWSKTRLFYAVCCWFLTFYILGYLAHLGTEQAGTKYHFFLLYLFVEAAAWAGAGYLNAVEKRIFVIGQFIGLGEGLATLLLSDMGIFSALPYLIPGICVCFLPLGKLWEAGGKKEGALKKCCVLAVLFCGVMMFRNFIYRNGCMTTPRNFYEDSIFGVTWTARQGPLKGIVNDAGAYVADVTYLEWQEKIQKGDRVLVVSYPTMPAAIYLNQEVEICTDSTISTPTYSERLFTYWEENPDKYPDVVVVKYFDGSFSIGEYNEVTEWLTREVFPGEMEEGAYWRYYYRNGSSYRSAPDQTVGSNGRGEGNVAPEE